MATTAQHYDAADRGLEQAEVRLEQLRQNVANGALGYAEGELACHLLELEVRIVAVHAQLAAVTE